MTQSAYGQFIPKKFAPVFLAVCLLTACDKADPVSPNTASTLNIHVEPNSYGLSLSRLDGSNIDLEYQAIVKFKKTEKGLEMDQKAADYLYLDVPFGKYIAYLGSTAFDYSRCRAYKIFEVNQAHQEVQWILPSTVKATYIFNDILPETVKLKNDVTLAYAHVTRSKDGKKDPHYEDWVFGFLRPGNGQSVSFSFFYEPGWKYRVSFLKKSDSGRNLEDEDLRLTHEFDQLEDDGNELQDYYRYSFKK